MDLSERIDDLERRLQRSEDLLEIQKLVATYGPSVDGGVTAAAVEHWTDDGRYGFGTEPSEHISGAAALAELFDGPMHQGIIAGGSAHLVTPPAIELDGDDAWGTGYSVMMRFNGEPGTDPAAGWHPARVSSVRWTFRRVDGRWRTVDRTNLLLTGDPDARALLSTSFTGAEFTPRR